MCTTHHTYTLTSAVRAASVAGTLRQATAVAVRTRSIIHHGHRVEVSLDGACFGRVTDEGPCERLRAHCKAEALEEDAEHERVKVFADHLRDCARALRMEADRF